jgi:PAS domain S-box-containing protein
MTISSGKNKKINILIVEDSPTQAQHLKLILEKEGYNVSVAGNGKEALSLLATTPQEMVISDIVMPEMDGYELCRTIKQDERFKQIPVILVTVLYDPQDVIRGLECGANNFISKPYDEKYLLSRIEIVLASSYAEETEKVQIGLEISFAGKKHHINASRLQILNMLLSTYETAVQKNQELTEARDQLRELNEHLEDLVAERTLQLENTNRQLLEEIEVRKKTEEALQRKTRAYRVISECNQFMVRTSDEQDLIKGICKILVTLGGYRCAWAGYARHDKDKTVEPVAQSGFEQEYLKNLQISWKKGRHGKGPTGTAIRTGNPIVIHDIPHNPKCGSWSSEAIRRDYSTVAAFPLIIQKQAIGALTIYSSNPEALDPEEMQLLSEMTGDLAFGIASIRTTIERKQAEEKIESLAKFPEENPNPIFRIAHDGILLFANRSAEFLINEWRLSVGTKVPEFLEKILKEGIESGSRLELEKTAGERTYLFTIAPIIGQNYVNLYGLDITERKKAEAALITSETRYRRFFEAVRDGILILDAETGIIVDVNPFLIELLGFSHEQFLGKKIWEIGIFKDIVANQDKFEELKRNKYIHYENLPLETADGRRINAEFVSFVYQVEHQTVIQCNIRDITERKRAEEALRESEERFRELTNSITDVFFAMDQDLRYTYWNKASEELTGIPAQDAIGKSIHEIFADTPETRRAVEIYQDVIKTEHPRSFENEYNLGGKRFYFDISVYPTADGIAVISTDITGDKEAEEALKKSTRLLTDVGEMAKVGGWELDLSTKEVSLTEEVSRIHGVEPGYKLNLEEAKNFYAPKSRAALEVVLKKAAETGEPYDLESLFIPSGSKDKIWVRSLGKAIYSDDKIVKLAGTFQNIDKYKRAEETLRETNEYLHKLIDYASAPIMVWDPRFLITRFNEAFEHLTGRTEQEVLGQKIDILFPAESREASLALIKKTLEGERWESVKIPILAADGTIHTVLWNSANILTADAELVSTIAQGVDITQSEMAEKELRESENRYRHVVEDQTEFICRFTPEGKLTFVNDAYCRHFGLKREECIGKRHSVVLPPDDVSLMIKHIRSLTRENPVGFIEHQIIMPSGEVQWQRWSDRAIFDKDGHVVEYQSVGKDITDRKQAEEEIQALNRDLEKRVEERTSQLNQSLGEKETLLKEIHHRVKNNLQIITSLLNLQSRYIKDEPTLAAIKESQNRVKAMALVHEKLYQAENIAKINLDDYIRSLVAGLIQFYGAKIRGIKLTTDIQDIHVDINAAIPLGLIINELTSNSLKYAFPDRERGEIFISVRKENHTLSVLFKDNGVGIPADLDWRNTESLGLRLVISLVEQLNGTIELDRSAGTAFSMVVQEKE